MIAIVIEKVEDMGGNQRARYANERLNVVPERDEIERAIKNMRESSLGEDRVRLMYISKACEDVRMRVIEIVRMMFARRANKWESAVYM